MYILQTKIIKYLAPEDASSKLCYSALGYLVPFVVFFNSTFLFMVTDHRGGWLVAPDNGHRGTRRDKTSGPIPITPHAILIVSMAAHGC